MLTYSILARDDRTGEMGVAQSQALAVGSSVPWAMAGCVIATQSMGEPAYGQLGLEAMAGGLTATEALTALRSVDPHPERRQVAMIDGRGGIALYTGDACVGAAGELKGDGCCAVANMVASPAVWEAMVHAFESATGDLAMRLLAALHAAEDQVGDIRGRRSAAIIVVRSQRSGHARAAPVVSGAGVWHAHDRTSPGAGRRPEPAAVGVEPHHLLTPTTSNQVWHLDLTTWRPLWQRYTVAAILDGWTRRLLALRVYHQAPRTAQMNSLIRRVARDHGRPNFIITDHGPQFRRRFSAAMANLRIHHVRSRVRQPFLNGKVERLFRSLRTWWRGVLPALTLGGLQARLDRFRDTR